MNTEKTVLVYHHSTQHGVWLSFEHGKIIPHDLTTKILRDVDAAGAKLKNGDRFTVRPRSGIPAPEWFSSVWPDGKIEVEFRKLTPPSQALEAPQSLEDWHQWLSALVTKWPGENLESLRDAIMNAQVFEFGNVSEARLRKENPRAAEFSRQGYLKLPYKCVIYRWTGEDSGRVLNALLDNGGNMPMVQWGGKAGPDDRINEDGYIVGRTHELTHYIWPLSMMLLTKGVKTRVEVPAAKLQAKRESRGKAPLPRVTYVNAEHYYVAMQNTDSPGTHASPVPHLRRGHLRHYANGHVTWIKDMLVNCKSIDEVVNRNRYEVRDGGSP